MGDAATCTFLIMMTMMEEEEENNNNNNSPSEVFFNFYIRKYMSSNDRLVNASFGFAGIHANVTSCSESCCKLK